MNTSTNLVATTNGPKWPVLPAVLTAVGKYDPASGLSTSLDINDRRARVWIANAIQTAHYQIADLIGECIPLADYIVHPSESRTNGQPNGTYYSRAVLIHPDGTTVAAGSDGVIQSLATIVACCGPGSWIPPIFVIPRQKITGSKRRWIYLELADVEPEKND